MEVIDTKINKVSEIYENPTDGCSNIEHTSKRLDPVLEDKLHQIAKREGFITYEIYSKNISADGNNYLSVLKEITIKGSTLNGNKVLDLFVKAIISGRENEEVFEVGGLYNTEMYMYNELSNTFNAMQDKAEIPFDERFKVVKYYKESNTDFIIMENMSKKGFGLWPRTKIISLQYGQKSIEALAKFHALSLVLQEKQPKYFDEHIRNIKFSVELGGEWEKFVTKTCENVLKRLKEHSQKKFGKIIPTIVDTLSGHYYPKPNSFACLCHGDIKTGNILMREMDGDMEVIPVDYQIIHYGSPFTDLNYFLFTTTDKEFRRKHLNVLRDHYYDTLKKFMEYFDLSIENMLPRNKYETLFKESLIFGLITAAWTLPIFLCKDEDILDFGNTKLSDIDVVINDNAIARIQEIVDDFIEWGYL